MYTVRLTGKCKATGLWLANYKGCTTYWRLHPNGTATQVLCTVTGLTGATLPARVVANATPQPAPTGQRPPMPLPL